jgi:hypothetical protein
VRVKLGMGLGLEFGVRFRVRVKGIPKSDRTKEITYLAYLHFF